MSFPECVVSLHTALSLLHETVWLTGLLRRLRGSRPAGQVGSWEFPAAGKAPVGCTTLGGGTSPRAAWLAGFLFLTPNLTHM